MPASDQRPSTAPKPRILPINRIILLLILAAFVAFLVVVSNQGGTPTTPQAAPVITVAPSAPTVATPPAPVIVTQPPVPAATPDVSTPQPAAVPTSAPSVAPAAPAAGTTVPATAEDVASQLGGSPDQWSKGPVERGGTVGPNGWIYRSHGTQQLHFVVPEHLVVDTSQGRFNAGAQIDAADFTIYWV